MNMISKKFPPRPLSTASGSRRAKTFPVTDPANGAEVATVPDLGAKEAREAIDAASRALPALVGQDRQGARRHPEALVRSRHRRDREPCSAHDDRTGQALGRIARRGRLWRLVHRVVRRGGQARLRAHDPDDDGVQALRHHQAADRRRRRDRAVELPDRHDHAQGGARARLRLHDRHQAGGRDAALRARHGQARPRRRRAAGRAQCRDDDGCASRRQGLLRGPPRAEALLHRLDRASARCSTASAPTP